MKNRTTGLGGRRNKAGRSSKKRGGLGGGEGVGLVYLTRDDVAVTAIEGGVG